MRGTIFTITALTLLAIFFGCSRVQPDAGEEAVLILKPWFIGTGGVDPTPVKTGLAWVVWTTEHVRVDMKPQQFTVHFDDLMSLDGVPLDFDSVIRLRVTDSVTLVSKFGEYWYRNNVEAEFMNRVRQAVRKHGLNETAIDTKAIDAIDDEVSQGMVQYIKDAMIPIELIGVTVGKANPPDSVKSQRIETASQQQRVLTEGEREKAEVARKQAETSRAEADNAYRNKMTLNAQQFIQLEQINMLRDVCGKSGAHCTFIVGDTDVSPVVNAGR